jgi:hypothetical protein
MVERAGRVPGDVRLLDADGREIRLDRRGWQHF